MRAGLLVALVALVPCGDALAQRRPITPAPSDQARATLRFDRPVHWLGENILAHFCVGNAGRDPFAISVGGDYQAASRAQRFKVTVTDNRGRVVPDPDPSGFNFGGMGFSPQIEPGAEWCQSLPLVRYARIDDPGAYTVSVVHDLGWPDGRAPKAQAGCGFTARVSPIGRSVGSSSSRTTKSLARSHEDHEEDIFSSWPS